MFEHLITVLLLSLLGGGLTALLLLFRPLTVRWVSPAWQVAAWLLVLFFMAVPVWQWIPRSQPTPTAPTATPTQTAPAAQAPPTVQPAPTSAPPDPADIADLAEQTPLEYRTVALPFRAVRLYDLLAFLWLAGAAGFLLLAMGSYIHFLYRKRQRAHPVPPDAVFLAACRTLSIRRKIRLRACTDSTSPMLVGILRPVIYLPDPPLPEDRLRMVLLHELAHYKRKDLLIKWLATLVNAVHWFNPLAYLACARLGEALEMACDRSVTRHMTQSEQTLYMQTILDLVQHKKGG